MKGLVDEFLHLFKEHKLLVATLAVITVPILYAGMFLWAFWDPYDHLADLPIAVVNEDEGAMQEDEELRLGDDLVEKLSEDPEFNFKFVDKKTAYQGLQDEDYYILVEIPEEFSKNATTIMDEHPEKLNLIYMPNESYNFLASQIGETAMLQIQAGLQEKITETYAETIFDKIDEVADGLDEASDATDELNDGAKDLQAGSQEMEDHLKTLAEKSIEFTNGVSSARSGTNELADGSHTLADGMHELQNGSNQLLQASEELKSGSTNIAQGIDTANEGAQQLNEKIPSLVHGTEDVLQGVTTLHEQLPNQLSTAINEKLTASNEQMSAGLSALQNGITSGLTNELAGGISSTVSTSIADEMIATQKTQTEQLANILVENGIDQEVVTNVMGQLQNNSPSKEMIVTSLQEKLTPQLSGAIGNTVDNIDTGFQTYQSEVDNNLQQATTNLKKEIKTAINPSFNDLSDGIATLNAGQQSLQTGVAQLAAGTDKLEKGSDQLTSGQNEYVSSMEVFTSKFKDANDGADSLAVGTNTLITGMLELEEASVQLSGGADKLATGSLELTDGTNKLLDGTNQFSAEMNEAAEDANKMDTNEETYKMIANPVDIKNEKINNVPNYGTGFAPYFLSLGLFVGALLLSIVYPLREPAGIPTSGINWFLRKFTVLAVIGVLQALIASGFLLIVLKLQVQSVPLFLLFSIITSLVFITLIQFLVTCLQDPGRFIAILLLIMQLTTSARTFPLELIPKMLQPINQLLPMTYSVSGFKAVISSGDFNIMWQNAGILLVFTVVFILLTLSYFIVMFKRRYGAMQEANASI